MAAEPQAKYEPNVHGHTGVDASPRQIAERNPGSGTRIIFMDGDKVVGIRNHLDDPMPRRFMRGSSRQNENAVERRHRIYDELHPGKGRRRQNANNRDYINRSGR